ncbi:hypothetical protein QF001_000860 [Paraburkholderia youngii]|uniref:hypothetical protein n=1 Tax=Paraburkholderia youngii TaxID=2782701 RepID=UPI003D1C2921
MSEPLLPEGWTREEIRSYGTVIEWPGHGFATVDERVRGFALGMQVVRMRGDYAGRGWKDRLYADAVKALQEVFERRKAK